MSSPDKVTFVLSTFLEKNLLPDNSEDYALSAFPAAVIFPATQLLVHYIGLADVPVPSLASKKQVNLVMELFGVTFAMPVAEVDLMEIARRMYRQWLEDFSFVGDRAKQNKFLRRIITQLSLPFELRDACDKDILRTKYRPFLSSIIDDLRFLLIHKGQSLDLETYLTLFHVLLGISDTLIERPYHQHFPRTEYSELKQTAINLTFDALFFSDIVDADAWSKFTTFARGWSRDVDFLKAWNRQLNVLFGHLLRLAYKLPVEAGQLTGGLHVDAPISGGTAATLFRKLLDLVDYPAAQTSPNSMFEVYCAARDLTKTAQFIADSTSGFLRSKFPAASFLKIVGPLITTAWTPAEGFDQAIAANVETIVAIASDFEKSGVETLLDRLLTIVVHAVATKRPLIVWSFLSVGNRLFASNTTPAPLLAQVALKAMSSLTLESLLPQYSRSELVDNVSAMLISSSEVLRDFSEDFATAFATVWELAQEPRIRFRLICYSSNFAAFFTPRLLDYFTKLFVQTVSSATPLSFELITGCVAFIGLVVVFRPAAADEVARQEIVPTVVRAVMSQADLPARVPDFGMLVAAVLQMLHNLVQWGNLVKDVKYIFDFVKWATKAVSPVAAVTPVEAGHFIRNRTTIGEAQPMAAGLPHPAPHRSSLSLGSKGEFDVTPWTDRSPQITRLVQSLLALLISRINLHCPAFDHFSRRLDSSAEVNEAFVMKTLNIANYATNYYLIGDSLLVAVMETKDDTNPLVLFARGGFGRTVWTVRDRFSELREPQLSDEIPPSKLPAPAEISVTPITPAGNSPAISAIPAAQFAAVDDGLRGVHGADFSKWLDWDKFAFYLPFNYKAPPARPRIVDFLAKMGLLEVHNKLGVRQLKIDDALKKSIAAFDALENQLVVPIKIMHVLPTDTALGYTAAHAARTSPLIEQFLAKIGEPLAISAAAADARRLPRLKREVPAFPCAEGFAALLSPAMCEGTIELWNSVAAPITIVFNETDFEINQKFGEHPGVVLVVKPAINGAYFVRQAVVPIGVISPFCARQLLTAKTLAFYLSMLIEMSIGTRAGVNLEAKRKVIIAELCQGPVAPEFGPLASAAFTS